MPHLPIPEIKGFTPLIDPIRLNGAVITSGRNFFVPVDGPTSGFSTEVILGPQSVMNTVGIQYFQLQAYAATWVFLRDGIYTYDAVANKLVPVALFATSTSTFWPWSYALVGGLHYFAHIDIGLLQFDPVTGIWTELTGGDYPGDIYAIAAAGGRLVALATGLVAWSTIDDGTDFLPSTSTGAGFQTLGIINSQSASQLRGLKAYSGGVLIYTTEGILRGELVESLNPFRWQQISASHHVLNPYCVVEIDNRTQIFLTITGFWRTVGGQTPEPWQPVQSEYFHRTLLPSLSLTQQVEIRLANDLVRGWFFVSIQSSISQDGVYEYAFQLDHASGEWGLFNKTHTGFIRLQFDSGPRLGTRLGFGTSGAGIKIFTDTTFDIEPFDFTTNLFAYSRQLFAEFPAVRHWDGANYMPSHCQLDVEDFSLLISPGVWDFRSVQARALLPGDLTVAGIVPVNLGPAATPMPSVSRTGMAMVQLRTAPAPRNQQPMDSNIEIGVFRLADGQQANQLSLLHRIVTHCQIPVGREINEDWNNAGSVEINLDWNDSGEGDEDWGFSPASASDYLVTARGTIDGETTWEGMQRIPPIVAQLDKARHLSCEVTGIYHLVRLSCVSVGDGFQLRMLELETIPIGVLA